MSDLALDPITGDILLTGTNQVRLTESFEEEAAQRLRMRLRRFLGEWVLDANLGIPYRRDVFVKNPDLQVIKSVFITELLKDTVVDNVVEMNLFVDRETRNLHGDFVVALTNATRLAVELGHLFLGDDGGTRIADDDSTPFVR